MTRYPTKRAVSAGGLVVDDRPDGRWVVLISHRNAAGALQWTLPKGGLEAGEDLEAAARREVREETGIACEILGELGVVDYWFVWRPDEVRYHKFVHYYVMRDLGAEPVPHDDEAEDVEWLPVGEAVLRLTHPNERELVARVADPLVALDAGPLVTGSRPAATPIPPDPVPPAPGPDAAAEAGT